MIVFFQRALRNYMQISSLQSFHRPSLTPSPQGVLISTPEFFFFQETFSSKNKSKKDAQSLTQGRLGCALVINSGGKEKLQGLLTK